MPFRLDYYFAAESMSDEWRRTVHLLGYKFDDGVLGERLTDRKPVAFDLYYSGRLTDSDRKDLETWKQEVLLVSRVPHLNLIEYCDHFMINKELTIISEYTEFGDLQRDLNLGNNHSYSERQARIYFRQIIAAINHLHRLGIAHRSVWLSKALVFDYNGEQLIKISDFGLGRMGIPNESIHFRIYHSSPERLLSYIEQTFRDNSVEYNSFSDDIWALGVCLFRMIKGLWPYTHNSLEERDLFRLLTSEANRQWSMTGEHREEMSDDCFHLLESMLEPNPGLRLNCEQIIRHN